MKKTDVDAADALLKKFCTKFEELYGAENCTPNLHLHLHLKDCLMDFGPPHAFWCFAFERCNGILGSLHTNNKSIEIQVMKKFLMGQQLRIMSGSIDAAMKVLLPIKEVDIDFVSCNNNAAPEIEECAHRFVWSPLEELKFFDMQHLKFLPPVREKVFTSDLLSLLKEVYGQLYPAESIMYVPPFYRCSGRVTLYGDTMDPL